jgi:peroxiredoxin
MKLASTPWFALAALALTAGVAAAQDAPSSPAVLAIGASAPLRDVKMKSVNGKDVSLAEVSGKRGTLVVFTCNHCPWAKAWQTRVAAIGNAARAKGMGVVAINSNDPSAYPEDSFEEMQARAKMLGLKFPYAVDVTSDLARAFGASHTPEAYVFDAAGKLVYHGGVDDNARDESSVKERWLEDAVNAVVAGKPVTLAETKAFGCSIKLREKKSS